MVFLKLLGTMWLVYLSLVFVRSFKESLRRERSRPPFGDWRSAAGGAHQSRSAGPDPFGPFGPFGPPGGADPFAGARARAQSEARQAAAQDVSQSPWQMLQLQPGASDKDIRRAYQDLIRQYHPDRLAQVEGLGQDLRDLAEKRTKEITAAYNQLKKKDR